jgi:hypothetical protein
MEYVCGIFIVLFIIGAIKGLFEGSSGSSESSSSSSSGGRTGSQMGRFELRARQVMRGKNHDLRAITIEGRGLLPVYRTMEIQFVTWAEDITDDSSGEPVLCSLSNFQHHENPTFQNVQDGGQLAPNQGFSDWVELGVAPLDALTFLLLLHDREDGSELTQKPARRDLQHPHHHRRDGL